MNKNVEVLIVEHNVITKGFNRLYEVTNIENDYRNEKLIVIIYKIIFTFISSFFTICFLFIDFLYFFI